MRCNNCGWDNAPGSSSCVKCGHSLQGGEAGYNNDPYKGVNIPNYNNGAEAQPRPTVLNNQQAAPAPRPTRIVNSANFQQQDPAPRPTRIVNSADIQGGAAPMGNGAPQAPQASNSCPHCGYPVMGNFTSCPNCGAGITPAPASPQQPQQMGATAPVAAPVSTTPKPQVAAVADFDIDQEVKCDKCGTMVSIDFTFCPKCGERIHLPTVRAIRHKPTPAPEPPKHKCHLTLIPEEDEQTEALRNDYEGDAIILTRENTEANNRTITSKEQAELTFEDGKWYLQNRSELGSTYLEASRKLELQPNDIIVLGDRRFKFEAE